MAKFKKYIIVEDQRTGECQIRFGYVEYHKHLEYDNDRMNGKKTVGGGMWSVNQDNMIIKLFGKSSDFGKASEEQIKNAIENYEDWMHLNMIIRMADGLTECSLDECYLIIMDPYS